MATSDTREFWLRGPLSDMPPLLQPLAHALLQTRAEVDVLLSGFPDALLWERPAGVASVGFHLQHLTGVLDRLFSYAQGRALTPEQLQALAAEGKRPEPERRVQDLVYTFDQQVDRALMQLRQTQELTLLEPRGVGRAQLPSTVFGLLVHATEHTTRHLGQLLATARIVQATVPQS